MEEDIDSGYLCTTMRLGRAVMTFVHVIHNLDTEEGRHAML